MNTMPAVTEPQWQACLRKIARHTGNGALLYFAGWAERGKVPANVVSINENDIDDLVKICYTMDCEVVELIFCSSGGSAFSAAQIYEYLRSKFRSVRVIVVRMDMSVAAHGAGAANESPMAELPYIESVDAQLPVLSQRLPSFSTLEGTHIFFEPASANEKVEIVYEQETTMLQVYYTKPLDVKIHGDLASDMTLCKLIIQACNSARDEVMTTDTVKIIAAHTGKSVISTPDTPVFGW